MEKQLMDKLTDQFCAVLKEVSRKGLNSANDIQIAKNSVSALVKLKALEVMGDEGYENESSGRRGYRRSHDGGSNDGGSYADRSYDGGSYRSYDSGSYDYDRSGHNEMREKLERMMANGTENERKVIRQVLDMM